jgi:hypothetical protein
MSNHHAVSLFFFFENVLRARESGILGGSGHELGFSTGVTGNISFFKDGGEWKRTFASSVCHRAQELGCGVYEKTCRGGRK